MGLNTIHKNTNLGKYNLDNMTVQEVYNAVCDHLLTQNEKSQNSVNCLYNGSKIDGDNLCCAAGIFVQDYHSAMEYHSWAMLVQDFKQTDKHKDLVIELQLIHDNEIKSYWHKSLLNFGLRHKFDISVLEKYKHKLNLIQKIKCKLEKFLV